MKNFKVRAWDEKYKEMYYIDDLYFFEEHGVHEIVNGVAEGHYGIYLVTEFTGQYYNNQELYEGDICYFTPILVETLPTFLGIIEWDKYRFVIKNLNFNINDPHLLHGTPYIDLDMSFINITKIGNKFENPELLPFEK